jgi:hypothetical protein
MRSIFCAMYQPSIRWVVSQNNYEVRFHIPVKVWVTLDPYKQVLNLLGQFLLSTHY